MGSVADVDVIAEGDAVADVDVIAEGDVIADVDVIAEGDAVADVDVIAEGDVIADVEAVPSGVTASNSQPTGGAGCGESASCATAPNSGGEGAAHQVSPTHQGRGVRRVRELRHGPEQEWGRPPRAGKARQNCHGPGGRILNYKPFSNSHPRRQIITVTNPRSPRLASPAGSWNRRV